MKRNLLLTPGPTQIPADLCAALGRPIIHHRTPQFQQNIKEVIEGLQFVLQTKNEIYLLASSGTGAMEASVCNLVSPGDKVITVEGGKFGERWTELCKTFGADCKVVAIDWKTAVQPKQIKDILDKEKDIKVVFITANETSTGVNTNVRAIAEVVSKTNAVLVVDAISSLGIIELKMDEWNVDVVVSASHKGFMLAPGFAFIAMNTKAQKMMEQSKSPRFYFDMRKYKKVYDKIDTPFTPSIGIIVALTESLKKMKEEGLENIYARCAKLAVATRAAAKALGLTLYPDESCLSDAVTAINVPAGVDGGKIVKIMRDTYGISIAGGQGEQLKGKIIRIAHMGCIDEYDILTGIACLEKVLKQLGHKFEIGAGLAAAQKVFNS